MVLQSFFFPSAPGFTAVSLDGSSFSSLIFFFYFYLYIIIMFYYLHCGFSSTFTFLFSFPFSFYFSGFSMARRAIDLYMGWFAWTKRTMDTVDLGAARMGMRQA